MGAFDELLEILGFVSDSPDAVSKFGVDKIARVRYLVESNAQSFRSESEDATSSVPVVEDPEPTPSLSMLFHSTGSTVAVPVSRLAHSTHSQSHQCLREGDKEETSVASRKSDATPSSSSGPELAIPAEFVKRPVTFTALGPRSQMMQKLKAGSAWDWAPTPFSGRRRGKDRARAGMRDGTDGSRDMERGHKHHRGHHRAKSDSLSTITSPGRQEKRAKDGEFVDSDGEESDLVVLERTPTSPCLPASFLSGYGLSITAHHSVPGMSDGRSEARSEPEGTDGSEYEGDSGSVNEGSMIERESEGEGEGGSAKDAFSDTSSDDRYPVADVQQMQPMASEDELSEENDPTCL
ncbi:hypothetical protein KIPB_007908, partial [Kipferlia bialata]|eukprot:g7908.t1